MRFILADPLKRRIPYLENTVDGILMYDRDNLYPQRMEEILNRSGAAMESVELFAKFVKGRGFVDKTFNKAVINVAGDTVKDLLRDCANDWATFKGFAIHVDFNAFLQPINAKHIPFPYVRFGLPDDRGIISKVVVCDDWPREKRNWSKRVQTVDMYNPDPEVIMKQIQKAGGIANYKGQILYFTETKFKYPLCSFDAVLADVETDAEIGEFKHSNVSTNFMASHIIDMPGEFDSDDERSEFRGVLQQFQGARNAGKILLFENKFGAEKPLNVTKVDVQDNDELFRWTEESVQTNIRKRFTQPAILVGDLIPGRLGNTQEIENSFKFYNEVTTDDRLVIQEQFKRIFSIYAFPVNTSGNYDIEELSFGAPVTDGTVKPTQPGEKPTEEPQTNKALTGLSGREWQQLSRIIRDYTKGKTNLAQSTIGLKAFGLSDEECKELLGVEDDKPE